MTTTEAPADSRRRQPRGDARKAQIIEAALELFAQSGYRGTGLTALAEKVGMTHPGLLYYFGTKERLLRAVVDHREENEQLTYGELTADIERARKVARFINDNPLLTRLFVVLGAENLDADDPLHDFFVDRYARSRTITKAAWSREVAEGRARDDLDLDQLAREMVATIMGLEIQWLMDPDAFDLTEAIDAYLEGLKERTAPPRRTR
jgi:AcrR family transcriptional regulator